MLNDQTGELLAVKLIGGGGAEEGDDPTAAAAAAGGEALRLCVAARHPNLVRCELTRYCMHMDVARFRYQIHIPW